MDDKYRYRQLLAELGRRAAARKAMARELENPEPVSDQLTKLVADHYPRQAAAVNDRSSLVAVLGTRRSGKSRGWLRRLVYDAATVPGSYQCYINTSWAECRRIAWRGARPGDGLRGLNDRYQLGAVFNKADRTMTFQNESVVECIPADDIRSIERALGLALHRVWVDEAQKMPHLDYAIREVIGPATADFDGQIVLTGTPSIDCSGLFYEVTKPNSELTGWSTHKLKVQDNPFFGKTESERHARTVLRHCEQFSLEQDDPEVRREWYGEWVVDDANFVYHVHRVQEDQLLYARARWLDGQHPNHEWLGGQPDIKASLKDLPTRADGTEYEWVYGLGTDLGYEPDPFAYVLWAWTWERPELFEVCSWKQIRLIPDEQAEIIREISHTVPLAFAEVDAGGGGKGIVKGWAEGWQDRYPIPVEEAPKAHKVTAIEFMNNDIRSGNIRLRGDSPLWDEMRRLTWAPAKGLSRRLEAINRGSHGKKRNPNDCTDAALYGHRMSQHHRYQAPRPKPQYGTADYWEQEEARVEQQLLDELEEAHDHWN